jgi:rhodanese-related sulfurtransferase
LAEGFTKGALVVKLAVMPEIPLEVSPSEVKARIDSGEAVRLIDVREVQEHQLTRIEGAELIPMNSIPQHLQDLDDDGPALIVFCHHGVRSLSVVDWLRRQGIQNCQSMSGGIDLWSLTVDRAVPRY